LENSIFITSLSLNIQKEKKEEFVHSILLPNINEVRNIYPEIRLFIRRHIEGGPVVNIYYDSIGEDAAEKVHEIIILNFQSYIEENKHKFVENDIYLREQANLSKMNGLDYDKEYENYENSFNKVNRLKRHGEYSSEEEEEVFNNWFFDNGQLLENTICLLKDYSHTEKLKFIISLFMYCSNRLNDFDLDGYLSFKSHYIGFISANKKMRAYHEAFVKQYEVENNVKIYNWKCNESLGYYIDMDDARKALLGMWQVEINKFVMKIRELDKLKANFFAMIHMLRFRSVSKFHNKAFALHNLKFYRSREFQAYRRVVNLIYILLPTLGFNTIDRLYSAVCLVKIIEGEILDGQIEV
jgi:hypothetical protein